MFRKIAFLICVLFLSVLVSPQAYPHCQIPCGIYDDAARLTSIQEHIVTIEKAMNKIIELSAEKEKNYNQIVRWVNNKDKHADQLSEIVTYYFMTQRLKPVESSDKEAYEKYTKQLAYLQQLLFFSMKSKQTLDKEYITKLRESLEGFHHSFHKH